MWGGATTDLSRFWFTTSTSLPGNTDSGADDVYDFTVATQVNQLDTLGNGNAAAFADVTADGSHVFWTTNANVGADTDGFQDVYDTQGATKTLVSGGTTGSATYYDSATDGSAVFYTTKAAIDGSDTDAGDDVYRRAAGTDTLMTPNGAGTTAIFPDVVSADGSRLAFDTNAALSPSDTDAVSDVYLSTGASPSAKTLLSGTGSGFATYYGATADLGQVFFATDDLLLPADQDPWQDIYAGLPGGSIELVSIGTNGGNAGYGGNSPDGSHVLIGSYERLAATDTDNFLDVFDLAVPAPSTTPPPDTTPPTGKLFGLEEAEGPQEACRDDLVRQRGLHRHRLGSGGDREEEALGRADHGRRGRGEGGDGDPQADRQGQESGREGAQEGHEAQGDGLGDGRGRGRQQGHGRAGEGEADPLEHPGQVAVALHDRVLQHERDVEPRHDEERDVGADVKWQPVVLAARHQHQAARG